MRLTFATLACVLAASHLPASPARGAEPTAPAKTADAIPYLERAEVPDPSVFLPSPPAAGSDAEALDRSIYTHTRTLQKTDPARWAMATSDAQYDPDHLFADFGCALGVMPTQATMPSLYRMVARIAPDSRWQTSEAKQHFARPRPYLDNDLAICVPRHTQLDQSGSYPSGHATIGWSAALILAELAPDRSSQILARGRAFGESRIVCGVHWASDVQAGYLNAAALVASLHSSQDFRADMRQAAHELAAARGENARIGAASRPDPAICAIEQEAETHSPLFLPQP